MRVISRESSMRQIQRGDDHKNEVDRLTYDALLEVLVETVVADLLEQQRVELLERLEVLEMRVDHIEVFAGAIRRPAQRHTDIHRHHHGHFRVA